MVQSRQSSTTRSDDQAAQTRQLSETSETRQSADATESQPPHNHSRTRSRTQSSREPSASAGHGRGQVGIGTLIVFIAMVLVAVLAAGVFLEVGNVLQGQGEESSDESVDQVTSRLRVVSVVGNVTAKRNDQRTKSNTDALADRRVNTIKILVGLGPGGEYVDLRNTTVLWFGPEESLALKYGGSEPYAPGRSSGTGFGANASNSSEASSGAIQPADIQPAPDDEDGTDGTDSTLDGSRNPHLTYHTYSPNSDRHVDLTEKGQLIALYINVAAVESGTRDDRRPVDLDPMAENERARVVLVTPDGGRTEIIVATPASFQAGELISL